MGKDSTMDVERPTWAEVDLRQLERNYAAIQAHLGGQVSIMAVVKADAYGHGAIAVSKRLVKAGAERLAVAIVREGVALREAGIATPILILGGFSPGQEQAVIDYRLTPAIFSQEPLERLAEAARRAETVAPYHLKVDTGMGRLGVNHGEVMAFVSRASGLDSIELVGIFTHLSSADEDEDEFTQLQVDRFTEVLRQLRVAGIEADLVHAANSAGSIFHSRSWFNAVRPGLALYGVNPNEQRCPFPIAPVLSLKTRIAYLKRVPCGTPLGYNRTFVAERESAVATLPIGYADGLNRLLSNRGRVIVRGRFAPIVGRVSMDLTIIDVTDIADAAIGDDVTIIGRSRGLSITPGDVAQQIQTIPYEVLTQISKRVPRVYLR